MHFNFPFQIFAWVASLSYALEVVATKLLSKHEIKNPWLLNFAYSGLVLIFTVPPALHFHAGLPSHWGNIVWAGVFWALANIFYIFTLYELDITTATPLFNARIVFTVILAELLLKEWLSPSQLIFVALVLVGGVLVSLDERLSRRSMFGRGTVYAVLAMLAFSVDAIFINRAIAQSGFWTVTLWSAILAQALFCLTLPRFAFEAGFVAGRQWAYILCVAIFDLIGILAANRAYAQNVSISSAIITLPLSALLAFILSLAVPKFLEKHTLKVYLIRLAGAALMVYAGIKLS
jgi:drug/metabolite transporter (DMT)-like permease